MTSADEPNNPSLHQEELPDKIVDDLESIKGLLDSDADSVDVPLLDDEIQDPQAATESNRPGLGEEKISALMGDDWQDSAPQPRPLSEVLPETQTHIQSAKPATREDAREPDAATPPPTSTALTLSDLPDSALKALHNEVTHIVDAWVDEWMEECATKHLDDLREHLVDTLHRRLQQATQNTKDPSTNNG